MRNYTRRKYNKNIRDFAKSNRKNPTKAEKIFWDTVLKNNKTGYRFLRQKPIDNYIMDFYCPKLKLCIEIDGGYHGDKNQNELDKIREKLLNNYNITIIRYTNDDVYNNLDSIEKNLLNYLKKSHKQSIEKKQKIHIRSPRSKKIIKN